MKIILVRVEPVASAIPSRFGKLFNSEHASPFLVFSRP